MRAKLLTVLSALTLTAFAGAAAKAEEAEPKLAWQEPGYVIEVVYATAPRVQAEEVPTLAWQAPGYEEEVVIASASRQEVLEAAGWFARPRPAFAARFVGLPAK